VRDVQTQQKVGLGRAHAEPSGMVAACFRAPQSGHPPRGNLDFRRIAHLPDDSHGEDEAPLPLYADTVTSLAVGLAAGALVLGLAATVIALRVASRLDGAREEGRRTRKLAEVTSTLDLDVLLERTLAATCALPGVESASVALTGQPGAPLVVASTPGDPEGAAGASVTLLDEDGREIGTLTAFPHSRAEEPALDELADAAGPALARAQRYREARLQADLDALTGLHNRRYFHETLVRECARSRRYDRRLALVVVDLDDFKSVNDRIGHLAGDDVLALVAERLRSVVRGADVACRIGGDEFAVILPEASRPDAERLYGRIKAALSFDLPAEAERLEISAGVAELGPEDDATSLFQRADEALYRSKAAGKGQVQAAKDR
jgi:diguanylate cyclase (GGDEF)-like protein